MIKAILIEDEEPLRLLIKQILQDIDTDVSIVSECESVSQATAAIQETNPDLLFLDILLTGGTAFDLLEKVPHTNFEIIFITAYDKYVMDAFKYAAIGYVLKPIEANKLEAAIINAQKRITNKATSSIDILMNYLKSPKEKNINTIAIPTNDGFVFLKPDDILRCQASGVYTKIILTNRSCIVSSYNLAQFKNILPTETFFQVQKSHLISLLYIERYNSKDCIVEMVNGDSVPVSRKMKVSFIGMFKKPRR